VEHEIPKASGVDVDD
jgi:hypothetical protein